MLFNNNQLTILPKGESNEKQKVYQGWQER